MNVSAEVFCVVCPIIELFESFEYEQGWVQWNAYVPIWLLSHTNTCIVPENSITVRRSWSDSRTSSNLFSCPARVLMLSATCFIILQHALIIVKLPEPWQKMRVFLVFRRVDCCKSLRILLLSFEYSVRLSSNKPKHYNVRQPGAKRKRIKPHTNCFGSLPAYPLLCDTSPWL